MTRHLSWAGRHAAGLCAAAGLAAACAARSEAMAQGGRRAERGDVALGARVPPRGGRGEGGGGAATPPAAPAVARTVTLAVGSPMARVLDACAVLPGSLSTNVLANFRYSEAIPSNGVLRLSVRTPLLVFEPPYPTLEPRNNPAFGSTESGHGGRGQARAAGQLDPDQDSVVRFLAQAGVGIARDFYAFDTYRFLVERPGRPFDFAVPDAVVDACRRRQIEYIGRLTWDPAKKSGGPLVDEAGYAAYVKATVSHFKGRIRYWQVLKEPAPNSRGTGGDSGIMPDEAARILRVTYAAVKDADPDALVYFPGTGPRFSAAGYNNESYFEAMLRLGAGSWFDVLGFDAYMFDVRDSALMYRRMLRDHGLQKPIWVAQTGVPDRLLPGTVRFHGGGGDPVAQSAYMVAAYAEAFACGAERVFWGEFIDSSEAEARGRDDRSLIWDSTGLFCTGSWRLKPAYYTHRLLAAALRGFVKAEKTAPGVVAFVFADSRRVYVVWNE